jgi:hypothetical protein
LKESESWGMIFQIVIDSKMDPWMKEESNEFVMGLIESMQIVESN